VIIVTCQNLVTLRPKDTSLNPPDNLLRDAALHRSIIESGDADMMMLIALAASRAGAEAAEREWLERAADFGHPTVIHYRAAQAEREGDSDGSWELMQQALEADALPALTRLGRIARLRGDEALSHDLLLRSAKLGDSEAMFEVANYATSRDDNAMATLWYMNAVEREAGRDWPIERGVGFFLL